jgi:hypothetical protein
VCYTTQDQWTDIQESDQTPALALKPFQCIIWLSRDSTPRSSDRQPSVLTTTPSSHCWIVMTVLGCDCTYFLKILTKCHRNVGFWVVTVFSGKEMFLPIVFARRDPFVCCDKWILSTEIYNR